MLLQNGSEGTSVTLPSSISNLNRCANKVIWVRIQVEEVDPNLLFEWKSSTYIIDTDCLDSSQTTQKQSCCSAESGESIQRCFGLTEGFWSADSIFTSNSGETLSIRFCFCVWFSWQIFCKRLDLIDRRNKNQSWWINNLCVCKSFLFPRRWIVLTFINPGALSNSC